MIENSTQDLTLLDPDLEVVLTREEHYQPVLTAYAPLGGRARRVAVELDFAFPPARPGHAAHRLVEARIDGQRVGELTPGMSERYGLLVEEVLRYGGRPACVGLVRYGRHGLEVELRLPRVPAATAVRPTVAPVQPPAPPPGARRGAGGPDRPRRSRKPYLIGAAVVAVLGVIGANLGGGAADSSLAGSVVANPSTIAVAPADPTTAAPTAVPVTTEAPPRPTPSRTPAPTRRPAPRPTPRTVAEPAPPPAVAPTPLAEVTPEPVAQAVVEVAPTPAPVVVEEPEPVSDCDPNYGGCVPVARDVDCASGSGNGPVYATGPVEVIGTDIYGLDGDGDGTGCNS